MLFGRATRGMRGWDMEANRMVYIKDYWRAGGEKEGRYTGVLRKRMFPIFPDFTAGTMCVMKYARTMSLRKGTRQCRKSKHQIRLVPGQARSDIIE